MSVRKALLSLALVTAAIPAAFAGTQSVWVGGEAGFETINVPSSTTRAEVRAEFQAFRKNPVMADGGRQVGGEAGYVFSQRRYDSPKPGLVLTQAERGLYEQQYIN